MQTCDWHATAWGVQRFLRILVLSCVLAQTVEVMATAATLLGCAQRCPDDADEGRCSTACAYCSCCAFPRTLIPADTQAGRQPAASEMLVRREPRVPSSPDPGEIFHVPKVGLA